MKYWIILISFYTLTNAFIKNHGQGLPYLMETGRKVMNSNLKMVKTTHVWGEDYGKISQLSLSQ